MTTSSIPHRKAVAISQTLEGSGDLRASYLDSNNNNNNTMVEEAVAMEVTPLEWWETSLAISPGKGVSNDQHNSITGAVVVGVEALMTC